jgi:hypothetical protein
MHTLDPSVVETYEARIERQEQLALEARNKGHHEQGDIHTAEAAKIKATLNEYRSKAFPQK